MKQLSNTQLIEISKLFRDLRSSREFQRFTSMLKDEAEEIHVVTRNGIAKIIQTGHSADVGTLSAFYSGLELGFMRSIDFVDQVITLEEQRTEEELKKNKQQEKRDSLLGKHPA